MVATTMKVGLGSSPVPSTLAWNMKLAGARHAYSDSQTFEEGAGSPLYLPSGHFLHFGLAVELAPSRVYLPLLHLCDSSHTVDEFSIFSDVLAVSLYRPSGHVWHTFGLVTVPAVLTYLPCAHG